MGEHLLNIREAAEYLGVGERVIKELVDSGRLPAYKIGGTFLRFKKSQLILARTALYDIKTRDGVRTEEAQAGSARRDAVKDFLYFNDFYILSAIVIIIAVVLIIAT